MFWNYINKVGCANELTYSVDSTYPPLPDDTSIKPIPYAGLTRSGNNSKLIEDLVWKIFDALSGLVTNTIVYASISALRFLFRNKFPKKEGMIN